MSHSHIQVYDLTTTSLDILAEVKKGLNSEEKHLSPALLYDHHGSELFDEITTLPEYYVTRTEMTILRENAEDIAKTIGDHCLIVEPGSGNCRKIRYLLPHFKHVAYMPMDISKEFLLEAAEQLVKEFPELEIQAVCADFTQDFQLPHARNDYRRKIFFFPGSTIGNYEPQQILVLLQKIANVIAPDGGMLIGVDLKKCPAVLEAAYDDVQGVSADFSLNLLNRLNHELQADFQLNQFQHQAHYNPLEGRIEINLVSLVDQSVTIAGERYFFPKSSSIHTENSYKFTVNEFQALAIQAGFKPCRLWLDKQRLFSLHYFT